MRNIARNLNREQSKMTADDLEKTIPVGPVLSCIAAEVYKHLDPKLGNFERSCLAKTAADNVVATLTSEGYAIHEEMTKEGL